MTNIPLPLAHYIDAANRQNIEQMLANFAQDAIVHDEGETYTGHEQIRAWMHNTNEKYNITAKVLETVATENTAELKVEVSGTFPGSPAVLTYKAQLRDNQIAVLEFF